MLDDELEDDLSDAKFRLLLLTILNTQSVVGLGIDGKLLLPPPFARLAPPPPEEVERRFGEAGPRSQLGDERDEKQGNSSTLSVLLSA